MFPPSMWSVEHALWKENESPEMLPVFGVCSTESIVNDDVTLEADVSPPEYIRKQLVPKP